MDERRKTVSAFDLPVGEAESGLLALIGRNSPPHRLSPTPLSEIILEAPIPRPRRNVFCIGKNYREHVEEFASSGFDWSAAAGVAPQFPIVFSKVPECVVAHHDVVRIDPSVSEAIDYEAAPIRHRVQFVPRIAGDRA